MFRSDRDALSDKVDELRGENERLRAENEALREDLLARRAADPADARRGNVYQDGRVPAGERAALSRHQLSAYPIWATVVWHVLTLGIASAVRFNLIHDRLPKAEHDDPSAFKAIALHLVPYFNLYWVFFNGLRLTDRLNFQLRARGEGSAISRSWVIAAGVMSVVPYINLLLAPIVWLVVAIQMQRAVNRVVELDEATRAVTSTPPRFEPVVEPAVEPAAEPAAAAGFADARALEEARATEEAGAMEEASTLEAAPPRTA